MDQHTAPVVPKTFAAIGMFMIIERDMHSTERAV